MQKITSRQRLIEAPRNMRNFTSKLWAERHNQAASKLEGFDLLTVPFSELGELNAFKEWWLITCNACGNYADEAIDIDVTGAEYAPNICKACIVKAMELLNAN